MPIKQSVKSKLIAALGVATGSVGTITIAGAMAVYDMIFKRYEGPNLKTLRGLYSYDMIKDEYQKEVIEYKVDKVILRADYYEAKYSKGLVIFAPGLKACTDEYIPLYIELIKNNYSVFAVNYKGVFHSDGDTMVGMCESLVDIDKTIEFIQNDERFSKMPLFLMGHSWGGYAVTSVLALKKNIKAVVSIAGVFDGYTLFAEKGQEYAGKTSNVPKVFLDTYQKILFKEYTNYNALVGLNSCGIPVLIAHGTEDKTIKFDTQSIVAHKEEITNPSVKYFITKGLQGGHDSLWHSLESIAYQTEIDSDLKILEKSMDHELTEDDIYEFNKNVDHRLYSEVNKKLFDQILDLYNKAL